MTTEEIKEQTMKRFNDTVRDLSQTEYRDVLEEVISELECQLDCVKEELRNEE